MAIPTHKTTALILLALISACVGHTETVARSELGVPAAGSYYHGVYPGGRSGEEDDLTPADVASYEEAVGREVAWVYFSNNWYRSRAFPQETAAWIRDRGALPFIRLMLRSSPETYEQEEMFALEAILRGDFDDDLRSWGASARAFGTPLIVEWGTEANGDWFSWNGRWNGGAEEGPRRFRDAYRHIVKAVDAANVTWVFHVNAADAPNEAWNALENYYPGDDVVDWLGVSVYGAQTPAEQTWPSFVESMEGVIPRLERLAPQKPIFVLEFGAAAGPYGGQAAWAREALSSLLSDRWASVRGFSWWNETWENDENRENDSDMRVQTNPEVSEVFREGLGTEKVVTRPLLR